MKYYILELVPIFFRTRWPLKKYYWQKEDIDRANQWAKEIGDKIKWG